jgi:O-methyltransferase involved in polyketide biosynthesis
MRKLAVELGDVQKTSLIPLYSRAIEMRSGSGILRDPKAVEIVEAVDYDFSGLDEGSNVICCVLRAAVFDDWARRFIARHPFATVIEIGAGLNSRYERLDNGHLHWMDLDLEDVMRLRRHFFIDTNRRTSVAGSVVDENWADLALERPAPYLLLAEGVFAYLSESQVRGALGVIARRFAGARVAFDFAGRGVVEAARRHGIARGMNARLAWACDDARHVEAWNLGYTLLESWTLTDLPPPVQWRLPPSYLCWTGLARVLGARLDGYRFAMYSVGPASHVVP